MTDKNMGYDNINHNAFFGRAIHLKEMLFKYGHDKNAVLAMQNGLEGDFNDGRQSRKGQAIELEEKNKIMADFRAKRGDFEPQSAESKLAEEYNKMAQRVVELEALVEEQKKTIEKLKKNPPEQPSIH